MSALIEKLESLWLDKSSTKNRNDFIVLLAQQIKRRSSKYIANNPALEQVYNNRDDAFSDTILLAFRSWQEYENLEDYLTHVLGYLKYYKYYQKYHQQKYLACEYEFIERLKDKYALQVNNDKSESILKTLPLLERDVLEMFILDGWSKKEIGDRFNIPESTVATIYKKSLKLCRLSKVY
jgi:RNA polymerase sigma factor (sigma-70 family)